MEESFIITVLKPLFLEYKFLRIYCVKKGFSLIYIYIRGGFLFVYNILLLKRDSQKFFFFYVVEILSFYGQTLWNVCEFNIYIVYNT